MFIRWPRPTARMAVGFCGGQRLAAGLDGDGAAAPGDPDEFVDTPTGLVREPGEHVGRLGRPEALDAPRPVLRVDHERGGLLV